MSIRLSDSCQFGAFRVVITHLKEESDYKCEHAVDVMRRLVATELFDLIGTACVPFSR